MPTSQNALFAKYRHLANRLEQHLLEINDQDAAQRQKRLSEEQFNALCASAGSDPVVRDWLYCVEHGYPNARSVRRDAA